MKLIQRLDDVSPMLCRLMARKRYGRPRSSKELSDLTGIALPVIEAYSWSASWNDIPIASGFKFARACGIDFASTRSMNRAYAYLNKNPTFKYLRQDPQWETYYKPLLLAWYSSFNGRHRNKDSNVWPPIQKLLLRLDQMARFL